MQFKQHKAGVKKAPSKIKKKENRNVLFLYMNCVGFLVVLKTRANTKLLSNAVLFNYTNTKTKTKKLSCGRWSTL
uniref:Uncharacterized protein n=1 Tax=Octopus bimaculoides TaxID=37653 RepID=A0A0L8G127_OCTBM